MLFIARMRELAGGKPAGFKLCVGSRTDVLAICKAMVAEGITPDFIVVDGGEGGTGAAPQEYEDHIGTPLTEGLLTVHNALVASGLRDRVKIGATGKVATGVDIVKRILQGADYTNAARAMMMATGCIQAQTCHTNTCPVGVATQDPRRMRALDVDDKTEPGRQLPVRDGQAGDAGDRLDGARRPRPARTADAAAPRSTTPGPRATRSSSTTWHRASCSAARTTFLRIGPGIGYRRIRTPSRP